MRPEIALEHEVDSLKRLLSTVRQQRDTARQERDDAQRELHGWTNLANDYRNALIVLDGAADWYLRCLEDIQDGRSVAGLQEAKLDYASAHDRARDLIG